MKVTPVLIERMKEKLGSYRAVARALGMPISSVLSMKDRIAHDNIKSEIGYTMAQLLDYKPAPKNWTKDATKRGGSKKHSVLAMVSDVHYGQVTTLSDTLGYNEYNTAICERRMKAFATQTIDFYRNHLSNYEYEHLDIVYGGDLTSGGIHEELAASDEMPPLRQAIEMTDLVISQINLLKTGFKKIRAWFLWGNHGRITQKSWHKYGADTNLDYLIGHMVSRHFANDPDVAVEVSESYAMQMELYGRVILLEHGHFNSANGGGGWLGVVTPALRGSQKRQVQHHEMGKNFDLRMLGHYHCYLYANKTVVNGSMCGYDAYAADLGLAPEPPQQASFLVSEKRFIVSSTPIVLE